MVGSSTAAGVHANVSTDSAAGFGLFMSEIAAKMPACGTSAEVATVCNCGLCLSVYLCSQEMDWNLRHNRARLRCIGETPGCRAVDFTKSADFHLGLLDSGRKSEFEDMSRILCDEEHSVATLSAVGARSRVANQTSTAFACSTRQLRMPGCRPWLSAR